MPLRHTYGMIRSEFILTKAKFALTNHLCRYEENPSQDYLINAISISRSWSIQHLFGYAFDHFRRQFLQGRIHPAIVLGVARKYGIPSLIAPAVGALARPSITFASWCINPDILRHSTLEDVTVIGRMKEKLWSAQAALCKVPPVTHNLASCLHGRQDTCYRSWRQFWLLDVAPKLLQLNDELENRMMWIGTEFLARAKVEGMTKGCLEHTIEKVGAGVGWRAEIQIPQGAIERLMVPERMMLTPDLE